MKCKICGHRTNTLQAMQKHYRKAHPGAMKRKKKAEAAVRHLPKTTPGRMYCQCCGREL